MASVPVRKRKSPAARFNLNRAQVVDENFVAFVESLIDQGVTAPRLADDNPLPEHVTPRPEAADGSDSDDLRTIRQRPVAMPTARDVREVFESQITARQQDIVAREMRARNEGFYTIGSAGHEGNAVLGRLSRRTDMAFLHYRSGAFMAERSRKEPSIDFIRDTMLSFAASSDDPISGGRHKVWGSVPLCVPPQTSTIASHLPKAVGAALSLARAKRCRVASPIPEDSIIVCSFGDASVSHATAQTAFNAAARAAHQKLPAPILFVCEDNGIGISVQTPGDWIERSFRARHGIDYYRANGLNIIDSYQGAAAAIAHCRDRRRPVFLHLKVVRLLGHAGSDPETEYHTWEKIEANEARDPLLSSARLVVESGILSAKEVLDLYHRIGRRVRQAAADANTRPKLTSADVIMEPLAPYTPDRVAARAGEKPDAAQRLQVFGGEGKLPENQPPRHMAQLINFGLHDLLIQHSHAILFGEDVARKGGVYHVTANLAQRFGLGRVFNTVLDETTILGLGLGAAHVGLLPIPEIQYLAYYHNAEDQIRGEACSLQYFSNDQYRNPMVIRIAGWAYQKGFGGHFHNDNSIAALRDVPGLLIATPARGDDAVKMLRTCVALARENGRVVVFLEPIALYMMRDLCETKDGAWSFPYPPPGEYIPVGEGQVYHEEAEDVTILTFANGLYMSLRAAKVLREKHGVGARVVDLRWLNPLNEAFIVEQAQATGKALVVDEGRKTGGLNEAILAVLYEHTGGRVKAGRVTGLDTYIPLGAAANCVLPGEADIEAAVLKLVRD